ncbi:helix-turn-helix transcriptional regulator [uncultured Maricaulis sp.]|uniref:helix-turn-helix domain-containing protein n=1 Tax=uncultured Maricaulis sp. TaxID=174710 RepID=UPI0030DADE0F|tara:strand:+ start:9209 stop:9694 length:486 start_codon:yes stop_codon:yes gene_type:complete
MTLEINEDWRRKLILEEDGYDISAGLTAADPVFAEDLIVDDAGDDGLLALGRFINLMRRQKNWSINRLAEEADIDIGELLAIEKETAHTPEPRTIYQLSQVFGVSDRKLLGLSGLVRPKDFSYVEDAVRFAAKSESIEKLSALEIEALNGFIAVLSDNAKK